MKFREYCLFLGLALTAIHADSAAHARLRALLAQSDQPSLEILRARIEAAVQNPVPDLLAIAADSTLRNNVRQKAIRALQLYPEDAVRQFLEENITNETAHRSLRKSAVKAYAAGFYRVSPTRTESFLSAFRSHHHIGGVARQSLEEMHSKKFGQKPTGQGKNFPHAKKPQRSW